ncbi:7TM diverse intracellular signaling domain-containing protein [Leptospira ilyithenensis]|uniref:Helix-turn-helix domain-containing protein n=1 Tax=Leptospira ilyithenensis TaxID=2484901 RepID=A0A4R9LTU2_9LEPT|nr:7TM diverse intracellular signaling domain-containing protein [Leptospira ilyithenensis]TGN14113.1 helix-turn-helix domain-containing protein [Leptospira ilyithenensis]
MKSIRLFPLVFAILAGLSCSNAGKDEINITNRFEFYRDSTHNSTLAEIRSAKDWQKISDDTLSFNFTKDAIWLRGSVSDEAFQSGRIISLEWKALDSGILYFPDERNSYRSFQTGDTLQKSLWTLPEALDPSFQIPSEKTKGYLYIRLESKSLISFPIRSMDEKTFHNKIVLETSIIWLILGFCAVMFIVSLFYLFAFRLYEFFYYAVYVLTTTIWYNGQFGNSFHTFWPDAIWWQNRSTIFSLALGIAVSFQFVRMFLETKTKTPITDKFLMVLGIVGFVSSLCILFTKTIVIFSRIVSAIYLVSIPIILVTGIRIYLKGEKRIKFFLLSWGTYLCSGYSSIFYYLGIIPYSLPVIYGSVFIFPIDLFFLLFNLLQKYQALAGERNEILHRLLTTNRAQDPRYTKSKLGFVDTNKSLTRLEEWMRQSKPYLDEKLDLEKTSLAIGLNVQQTSELINSKIGMSFRAYLNSYRMEDAKELLKNKPDMSVLSIAFATGFGSKSTFNNEFKKSIGMTPIEYRKDRSNAKKKD